MSEIEKQAEKEIKKKIHEYKTILNNLDKMIPDFIEIKDKKDRIKDYFEEELLIWKFILKNFKKSLYKN